MTAQQIVDLLNEIHSLDPNCLGPLIKTRLPCNRAVADHPTIVVDDPAPDTFTVGLLGILEGVVGIDGELIGANWEPDENGALTGFCLIPFERVKREPVSHVPPASNVKPVEAPTATELQQSDPR